MSSVGVFLPFVTKTCLSVCLCFVYSEKKQITQEQNHLMEDKKKRREEEKQEEKKTKDIAQKKVTWWYMAEIVHLFAFSCQN